MAADRRTGYEPGRCFVFQSFVATISCSLGTAVCIAREETTRHTLVAHLLGERLADEALVAVDEGGICGAMREAGARGALPMCR